MNNHQLLLPVDDLRFSLINNPVIQESLYKTRYDLFCENMRVIPPRSTNSRLEYDEYDKSATPAVMYYGDEIVAHTRIIHPCNHFPIEDHCSLPELFSRSTSIETSRTFVVPQWRHSNAVWILCKNVYEYCIQSGYTHILSFSNAIMYNGFKKRGLDFAYIGNPIIFAGYKSYPLIIRVHKDASPLFL